MAAGFSQYNQFTGQFFDDSQLTYSAAYFDELRDYALPFNLTAQQMFDLGTDAYSRYQEQLITNSVGMFAPTPYGN